MCERHDEHSIELDCGPGMARPDDLLPGVIEGTGLAEQKVTPFFGMSVYLYSEIDCDRWDEIQKITKPRIEALYYAGLIRFGSW